MAFENANLEPVTYIDKPYFRQAHEMALAMVRRDRINEKDFLGIYPEEDLLSDKEYVLERERHIAADSVDEDREGRMSGEILEAIMSSQIELSDWLGSGVWTRQASIYDDYRNGVDAVAEMEREGGRKYLALAFDVTQSNLSTKKKFARIKKEIEEGTLTTVKYFEDKDGNKRKLEKCPRVVIGLDRDTVAELAALWVNNKKTELANHPVQLVILDEIRVQMESFRDYAKSLGKDDIAEIYEKELQVILGIIKEKENLKRSGVIDINKWREGGDRMARSLGGLARSIGAMAENESGVAEKDAQYDSVSRQATRNIRKAS